MKKLYMIGALVFLTGAWWYYGLRTPKPDKAHELRVGTSADFPPFSFLKDGNITGFDIDVMNEVGHRLNKKVVWRDIPFDMLIPEIQLGALQILAAGMTETPKRAERVLFTRPHIQADPLLVISSITNQPIKNLEDLRGKQIIVNDGYTADTYLSNIHDGGFTLKRLKTPAEAFLALTIGKADAYVISRNSAKPFFDLYGTNRFYILALEDTGDSYAFAISKKYPELLPQLQTVLDQMEHDGTLLKLKQKWGLA